MQQTVETFNDGILYYGVQKDQLSDKKKIIGKTFEIEGKLFFRKLSIREQDERIATANDRKIDLKVKTLYPASLVDEELTNYVAKIKGVIYEFTRVDHNGRYLFLYLTKAGAYKNG